MLPARHKTTKPQNRKITSQNATQEWRSKFKYQNWYLKRKSQTGGISGNVGSRVLELPTILAAKNLNCFKFYHLKCTLKICMDPNVIIFMAANMRRLTTLTFNIFTTSGDVHNVLGLCIFWIIVLLSPITRDCCSLTLAISFKKETMCVCVCVSEWVCVSVCATLMLASMWKLTLVVYAASGSSSSTRDRPKSDTLHTRLLLTRMLRAARSLWM